MGIIRAVGNKPGKVAEVCGTGWLELIEEVTCDMNVCWLHDWLLAAPLRQ